MKFLLVLAAVGIAAGEPEADPAFLYSVGAPLVHPYSAVIPYAGLAGCRNAAGALVPCAHGNFLPYGLPLLPTVAAPAAAAAEEPAVEEAARKRRDADADPAVLASSVVVKNPSPYLIHNLPVRTLPLTYTLPLHHGLYYGRKRREAEAEADAEADPWLLYGAYGHHPYGYSAFYTPYYHYAHGCTNYLGALVPCAGR